MENKLFKHRAIIQSQNIITAKQRKSFNALMTIAKPQLKQDSTRYKFTTTLTELKQMISTKKINNDELKRSLEELMDLKLEFNVLENSKWKSWHKMVLVPEIEINNQDEVIFSFSPTIRENIINPEIYGVIDMEVNKKLDGSHSIPIYEFCKDYIKCDVPRLELNVFKKLLGIEGKYKEARHLKIYVLEPATKEINEKSDIEIRWEFSYTGKKITHINFWSKKKEKENKKNVESIEILEEKQENESLTKLLNFCKIQTEEIKDFISENFEKYSFETLESNIKYTNKYAKDNYLAYFKKALAGDWGKSMREQVKAKEQKKKLNENTYVEPEEEKIDFENLTEEQKKYLERVKKIQK